MLKLVVCCGALFAIGATAEAETLLVHGGAQIPPRIAAACLVSKTVAHVILAGNEAEMYAMQTEVREQCPSMLPKTQLLPFYANNTADHVVCTLRLLQLQQQLPGTLAQLGFDYHMPRIQNTTRMVQRHVPATRMLYVGLTNPPNVAWRVRDEQDRFLPLVQHDVRAALTGPCALDLEDDDDFDICDVDDFDFCA